MTDSTDSDDGSPTNPTVGLHLVISVHLPGQAEPELGQFSIGGETSGDPYRLAYRFTDAVRDDVYAWVAAHGMWLPRRPPT